MESMKFLEANQEATYVLALPNNLLQEEGEADAMVMKREAGVMLAVPLNYIQDVALLAAEMADDSDMLGPSRVVHTPGVEQAEGGTEVDVGVELQLLLVDFSSQVVSFLKELDPNGSLPSHCFFRE